MIEDDASGSSGELAEMAFGRRPCLGWLVVWLGHLDLPVSEASKICHESSSNAE